MTLAGLFRTLADIVLIVHVAFVAFVVLGLLLILYGGCRDWRWIRNAWFRVVHLAAIGLVVIQSWLGIICPLTTLEVTLRERAGQVTYDGAFVAFWLRRLLFYEAPPWVFNTAYTAFGLAVVGSWIKFRPSRFRDCQPAESRTEG